MNKKDFLQYFQDKEEEIVDSVIDILGTDFRFFDGINKWKIEDDVKDYLDLLIEECVCQDFWPENAYGYDDKRAEVKQIRVRIREDVIADSRFATLEESYKEWKLEKYYEEIRMIFANTVDTRFGPIYLGINFGEIRPIEELLSSEERNKTHV